MLTPSSPAPGIDLMITLQNRWYNGLLGNLPLSPQMFQISRPAAPLSASDAALWACQNVNPPASLTFDRSAAASLSFFDDYAAVAIEMQFPECDFAQDIGEANAKAWTTYLATVQPPPTPDQLPLLFQSWAIMYAPGVVEVGVADLTEMALIGDGQQALAPYLGPHARPADFLGTWSDLLRTLNASSGASVAFDSRTASPDVKSTWTGGQDQGVCGLWTGSDRASRPSRRFAASRVTVNARFKSSTVWTSTPGPWYDSSLLHTAWSNQASPPWPANPDPTWSEVFGPEGSLLRRISALVVVDGVDAVITSDTAYDSITQQRIQQNADKGLWPFYAPSGGAVSNTVTFGQTGMRIETSMQPGHPVVLGENVIGIGRYLGES